jgi:hypothetical protein
LFEVNAILDSWSTVALVSNPAWDMREINVYDSEKLERKKPLGRPTAR